MKNIKELFGDRFYNAVFIGVAAILALWTCLPAAVAIKYSIWSSYVDYLYNYAGGFIRRGLTGEILFFITNITGIPPLVTSYALSIIGYIIVAWFTIARFRKHGYALNVLIMGFMLGGILVLSVDCWRRDYILMAVFIGIMSSYKRLSTTRWVVLGNICAVVSILLHEASFFFIVPVCVLVTNIRLNNIIKSVVAWIPSVAAFLLCCHYKGTPETLAAVCGPISEYAPEVMADGETPYLLSFIGLDAEWVLRLHIKYNFIQPFSRYLPIPAVFFTLFYFLYIPYVTVCMIKVFNRNGLDCMRQISLVSLILFQFIMLLPMFTLLSCDILRVGMYWMISSVVVWLVLDDREIGVMFPTRFNSVSGKISAWCFNRWLPGKMVLTLCMLFIGVTGYSRTATGILYCSPMGTLALIAKKTLGILVH